MKILMLADKMGIGGAETHIVTLARELTALGHSITVISATGAYTKSLLAAGIRCVYAPADARDPISVMRVKRTVAHCMRECDVVHAHTRFTAFIAKTIRGKGTYPPIAVTAHLDFPTFPYGAVSYFGDMALAVSEDIKEHLIRKYRVPSGRVLLTKNAVVPTDIKGSFVRERIILHVSRTDRDRAATAFMLTDIAPRIIKKHPEYRIMIVGDGDMQKRLTSYAKRQNLIMGKEAIVLTGARTDIPDILARAAIFVGVSRAALEAMAAGVPSVICGNEGYGGIACAKSFDMLARENFCARSCPAPTPDMLFADIDRLLCAPQLAARYADECLVRTKTDYSPRSMADDALGCYRSVIKPPHVCLMGFFGYSNLGDEITLKTAIAALRKMNVASVTVLTRSYTGGDARAFNREIPTQIARAIAECDIFVMCGGNLLQNETSTRSLFYYEEAMRFAKIMGKRVYMISSGFGKVHGTLGASLLTRGLSYTDFCGCRTRHDLRLARTLGARKCALMPDLCFLIEGKKTRTAKGGYFVFIPGTGTGVSADELCRISSARRLSCAAVILFEAKDSTAARTYANAGISCYFPKTYEHVRDILSGADFVISQRLHGVIFSLLAHTPCYTAGRGIKLRAIATDVLKHREGLVLPYSEQSVIQKKEIGAKDSDFKYVTDAFASDIRKCLDLIF